MATFGRKLLRGVTAVEIIAAFHKAGWDGVSQKGSHCFVAHPDHPGVKLAVPVHLGRDVRIGYLRRLIARSGMSVEEFEKLL